MLNGLTPTAQVLTARYDNLREGGEGERRGRARSAAALRRRRADINQR